MRTSSAFALEVVRRELADCNDLIKLRMIAFQAVELYYNQQEVVAQMAKAEWTPGEAL